MNVVFDHNLSTRVIQTANFTYLFQFEEFSFNTSEDRIISQPKKSTTLENELPISLLNGFFQMVYCKCRTDKAFSDEQFSI